MAQAFVGSNPTPANSGVNMKITTLSEVKQRLLKNISENNGCWEWQGAVNNHGYGLIKITNLEGVEGRNTCYVHRMSYLCHNKHLPYDKLVCHTCDNPICINPDHLFLGSNQDNMDDMKSKNRQVTNSTVHYGNNHAGKKVIAEGIEYKSFSEAARALGVSCTMIRKRIKNGVKGYKRL